MPTDIRSFFGGKTSTPIREKETKKEEDSKKKRSSKTLCGWPEGSFDAKSFLESRKIIDDSDDDEPAAPLVPRLDQHHHLYHLLNCFQFKKSNS
jgi:replication factor C subunit 1